MNKPTVPFASTPHPMLSTNSHLTVREKIAYGLGDTASNFYFQFFNLFLLFYYTDVFGLEAAAVGTMFLVIRIFDAVMDPLVGMIADRTNSRWGKFRPYILWGALPYGVIGYIMFVNPSLSAHGKLVFAYVTYGLMWVAYTAINIPYSALMGVMSPSSEERTSLSTYRFICAFSGQFLIALLVVKLKDFLGGGNEAAGFRYTMLLFSVVSVAMFLYTFAMTRERVQPPSDQVSSLREDVKTLVSNGPWVVLFFSALFTLTNTAVRGASIIYYFKYVVRDESKAALYLSAGSLAFIAGAVSTKLFLRWFERRPLMIWLTLLNAVTMASFYFVNPQALWLLYALNILATFLVGPTPAILWSMYADTADYGEWRFGRRTTGLVFSAAVFSQKLGLAIGAALGGWMLHYYGFVANEAQNGRTLHGINLMFSIGPAVFAILGGLAIFFYPLTEVQVKTIERDLTARKGSAAAAGAATA
jgi:GPH family glycoside/pentoside/hexuronide:cation symporter